MGLGLLKSPWRLNMPLRILLLSIVVFVGGLYVYKTAYAKKRSATSRQDKSNFYKAKFTYDALQKLQPTQQVLEQAVKTPAISFKDAVIPGEECPDGAVQRADNATWCGATNWWGLLEADPTKKIKCNLYAESSAKARKLRFSVLMPYNRTTKSDEEMVTWSSTCANLKPVSPVAGNKVKIAYIIHTKRKAEQVIRLLMQLYVSQDIFVIHIDERATPGFVNTITNVANCFKNVYILPKRYAVLPGGGWSQLRVEVEALSYLLNVKWDYAITIQSTDFPLRNNWEIHETVARLEGYSLIPGAADRKAAFKTSYVYSESPNEETIYRFVNKTKAFHIPSVLPIHHGKAYNIFSRRFADFADIQRNPIAQALFEFGALSYLPGTFYWPTLAKMEPKQKNRPTPRPLKTTLHYVKKASRPSACSTGVSRYGNCVLGVGDLSELLMIRELFLFASEVDITIDHYVTGCLQQSHPKPKPPPSKLKKKKNVIVIGKQSKAKN